MTWILYTLILLPSYFWPGGFLYTLYASDYYCGIPYEKAAGLLYTVFIIYQFPIVCLSLIYARLVYYIRGQATQSLLTAHIRRTRRDFLVIRRILFTVSALTLPGLPGIVFFAMTTRNPSISGFYYMYRTQWMGIAVAILILSIALLIITPRLKSLVIDKLFANRNRVMPAEHVPISSLIHTRFDR